MKSALNRPDPGREGWCRVLAAEAKFRLTRRTNHTRLHTNTNARNNLQKKELNRRPIVLTCPSTRFSGRKHGERDPRSKICGALSPPNQKGGREWARRMRRRAGGHESVCAREGEIEREKEREKGGRERLRFIEEQREWLARSALLPG